MDVCARCKNKVSNFKCDNCMNYFCKDCDNFIHSIPSKNNHHRICLNSNQNLNTNLNFNSISTIELNNNQIYSNENSMNNSINNMNNSNYSDYMNKNNINDLNELHENEKNELKKKIMELNQELNITKKALEERIEYLHKHLDEVNVKNKNDVNQMNLNFKNQIDTIVNYKYF